MKPLGKSARNIKIWLQGRGLSQLFSSLPQKSPRAITSKDFASPGAERVGFWHPSCLVAEVPVVPSPWRCCVRGDVNESSVPRVSRPGREPRSPLQTVPQMQRRRGVVL